MENYKPNSRTSKSQEKEEPKKEKIEKIVKGTVKTKKKNIFSNIFSTIDFPSIAEYIVQDVLIPTFKDGLEDTVSMMIRGGEPRRSSSRRSPSSRVSYRLYYDRDDRDKDSYRDRDHGRRTSGYAYDDIILETRAEALEIISRMEELIDVYGMASVADLYDLVGISGVHTDNKYGWTDIRSADTQRIREGYLLKMPRAIPLN